MKKIILSLFSILLFNACSSTEQIDKTFFLGHFKCGEADKAHGWDYDITVEASSDPNQNHFSVVKINGFQTDNTYNARVAVYTQTNSANFYVMPDVNKNNTFSLFDLRKKDDRILLYFKGLESFTNQEFIECERL